MHIVHCIAERDRCAGQLRARSMPTTTFQTSCRRDVRTKRRGGSDRNNNNCNNNNSNLIWADAFESTGHSSGTARRAESEVPIDETCRAWSEFVSKSVSHQHFCKQSQYFPSRLYIATSFFLSSLMLVPLRLKSFSASDDHRLYLSLFRVGLRNVCV